MPTDACDVLVIGGGPAGLRAAEITSGAGWRTVLADRMPSVGRKFLVAGRGGLNLTHSEPIERFIPRYGDGPLAGIALSDFSPDGIAQLGRRDWRRNLHRHQRTRFPHDQAGRAAFAPLDRALETRQGVGFPAAA